MELDRVLHDTFHTENYKGSEVDMVNKLQLKHPDIRQCLNEIVNEHNKVLKRNLLIEALLNYGGIGIIPSLIEYLWNAGDCKTVDQLLTNLNNYPNLVKDIFQYSAIHDLLSKNGDLTSYLQQKFPNFISHYGR